MPDARALVGYVALMAAVQALLVIAYPAIVYFALGFASPRAIALVTLALLAARLAVVSPARLFAFARVFAPVGLAFAATGLASLVWNDALWLLLAPAIFNFAMLAAFAASFGRQETTIEVLARAQVGDLSQEEVTYCRRVTGVWCGFFLANGSACAALALFGSRASWALYTGFIAYLLLGALFATEYVYRHWRFRRYVGAPTDALLRRLFPPKSL
jgi:uncharacterized membrane protein